MLRAWRSKSAAPSLRMEAHVARAAMKDLAPKSDPLQPSVTATERNVSKCPEMSHSEKSSPDKTNPKYLPRSEPATSYARIDCPPVSTARTWARHAVPLCILLAILTSCDRKSANSAPATPAIANVSIIISGDTAGWITPCGCTSNQSGGLPRRATYLKQAATTQASVYADVGGAAAGTSEYHRVKFEAILRGESLMDVAAHNIGGSEAALGAKYLRELQSRIDVPLISANTRDTSGELIAAPMETLAVGGMSIALVGVISPRYETDDVLVTDPRQAVLNAIAPLRGRNFLIVVLAYLPDDELQQLAANLPEADAIIGGPTGQAMSPRLIGPTLLASATNKGKFVVQLQATRATQM